MGMARATLLAALALYANTCCYTEVTDATSLLQRGMTPSSEVNHKGWDIDYEGYDILTLVAKVLKDIKIGPSPKNTRLVSFGVINAEPGATATATLPGARCTRKEGAPITDCYYDVNQSTNIPPVAHFEFGKQLSDLATMVVHANVTLKLSWDKEYVAEFNAFCKACGAPCVFTFLYKTLQLNLPDCPLPMSFNLPLVFPNLNNTIIDIGTEIRRANTPAVGYATRVES